MSQDPLNGDPLNGDPLNGDTALQCVRANKKYGHKEVLRDVTFDLPTGTVTALIGENGAGKSTLMMAIAGLIAIDSGSIWIGGKVAGSEAGKQQVSLMAENPDLYSGVSVWEHVHFMGILYGLKDWESRAESLLEQFEMSEHRDRLPHELSQGMRRRLSLVMALLRGAELFLLDEPFNGLDPQNSRKLRNVVQGLANEGKTVIVSTHVLSDVASFADEIILISRGSILAQDSLNEFPAMGDGSLEEVFLKLTAPAVDGAEVLKARGLQL